MIRKHYTPTFKAQVVEELLKEEKTLAQLARHRSLSTANSKPASETSRSV